MKKYILVLFCIYSFKLLNAQEPKVTVLNDSTELHDYGEQKIKVNYKVNGSLITIKQKDRLLGQYPTLHRDFNIINGENETKGEVNFSIEVDISKDLIGKPFPLFKLTDEDLRGQIVVLNFWYTTCGPCIAEMPFLNELVKKYKDRKVRFIASTLNDRKEMEEFLAKKEFLYEQTADIDPGNIFSPFPGWPMNVVIDQSGLIRFIALGKKKDIELQLQQTIESLLK